MPRSTRSIPKYRLHKASGQAVVTLRGKDYYLGPHGSPESRAEYDRLIVGIESQRTFWPPSFGIARRRTRAGR